MSRQLLPIQAWFRALAALAARRAPAERPCRPRRAVMQWRRRLVLLCLVWAASTSAASARAEEQWKWPEKGKNLQVLPKDFPAEKLSAVMRGFSRTLGVRCTYCHVGAEDKPLASYDFVSDKNPNKQRAREMYRMLGSIGDQLAKITPSGDRRVNMWCGTCHQGKPRPLTLEEDLGETYRKSGVAAAVARYGELRERYYGRAAYDFGEGSLNRFAHELLEQGDHDGAIAVFRLNAAQFPQSGDAWGNLAGGYLAAGKRLLAEICYRKALEVAPDNANALAKLRELATRPPD
jgi:tetratricopeptide (TPR) repeat protein